MLSLLVTAALAGATPTPTPTPTAVPIPATTDVRQAAHAAGFADIADRLAEAARPTTMVAPGKRKAAPAMPGTSRYGGGADLPVEGKWPRCKGRRQAFLAQVRLSDLPAGADELRRLGGTLLFFTDVQSEAGETEYGMWAGDCSKVIHVPAGTPVRRQARTKRMLVIKPARMRFTARPDIPDLDFDYALMPPLQDINVKDKLDPYWDMRWALQGKTYPQDKLLGYSNQMNGGDECSARAELRTGTWRHLFTFTTWEVADGGRLQLLISSEDLAAGRFDRVCGTFDSA